MNHRKGDRYLPVKVHSYPVPARGRSVIEYGYIYDRELHPSFDSALKHGAFRWGDGVSVAQIRGDNLVDWTGPDEADLELHAQHLAWVWS